MEKAEHFRKISNFVDGHRMFLVDYGLPFNYKIFKGVFSRYSCDSTKNDDGTWEVNCYYGTNFSDSGIHLGTLILDGNARIIKSEISTQHPNNIELIADKLGRTEIKKAGKAKIGKYTLQIQWLTWDRNRQDGWLVDVYVSSKNIGQILISPENDWKPVIVADSI